MKTASLAALVAVAALAQPGDGTLVTVQLRDGSRLKARAVRTDARQMLVLTRADGTGQAVPLRDVKEIRFGKPEAADPKEEKLWAELCRVRRQPFAGPGFDGRVSASKQADLAKRAAEMSALFLEAKDPERRMRLALRLAALRFALGDLDGCRQSLRTCKALAREAQAWDTYNEGCVRLAALQLPAAAGAFDPKGSDWRDCKAELDAGILEQEQRSDLKARIKTLSRLAGLVR